MFAYIFFKGASLLSFVDLFQLFYELAKQTVVVVVVKCRAKKASKIRDSKLAGLKKETDVELKQTEQTPVLQF
jgi:hypothetical protein